MHPYTSLLLLTDLISAICLNFISNYTQNPSLQIQLPDGLIQGRLKRAVDTGMPYYSYEGIPYAQPPVGLLRFGPPQRPEKWTGVLDANGDVPLCLQIPPTNGYEDEDCLYINVYVPKPSPESEQRKAVMVWIYGGGFLLGAASSNVYGPDYLLEKDVIVVHFNYRLNVFGFLATDDMASPGNYGLKDQEAALKWVQKNIHLFGGDPDNVTIFGQSAGGASVSYLLLSSKTRGLIHRAISQSGTSLCSWSLQTKPLNVAKKVAEASGFHFGDTVSMIQHLQRLNATALRSAAVSALLGEAVKMEQTLSFLPVLEPEHDDAFISESTLQILENGDFQKVPYIVGFNSQESARVQRTVKWVNLLLDFMPNYLLVPSSFNNLDRRIGNAIRDYYFGDDTVSRTEQYLEFFSDTVFNRPIVETARLYSMHAPTYMYKFSYEGYFLGRRAFSLHEGNHIQGVSHGEEIWHLFARDDLHYANATDKLVRERMITLWTNFAKYGNPTPDEEISFENVTWPKFEKDDYPYLNIDGDLRVEYDFKGEAMEFWRKLFAKYGRPPFNTY